jgi:hypothetical protein
MFWLIDNWGISPSGPHLGPANAQIWSSKFGGTDPFCTQQNGRLYLCFVKVENQVYELFCGDEDCHMAKLR